MNTEISKDTLGNRYEIQFESEPEKIKELRNKLQPYEKFDFTNDGLDAVGYFGEDNGKCSDYFQLEFKNSNSRWTYNGIKHSFVRTSQMAMNLMKLDDNPEYKLITEFFSYRAK